MKGFSQYVKSYPERNSCNILAHYNVGPMYLAYKLYCVDLTLTRIALHEDKTHPVFS